MVVDTVAAVVSNSAVVGCGAAIVDNVVRCEESVSTLVVAGADTSDAALVPVDIGALVESPIDVLAI